MFIDELIVKVIAGNGGDGCTSFRREKYVPKGGPDGGNGGKGGNVVFVGDRSLKTLIDFKYKKIIKARKGEHGKGSNRYGANSDDIELKVPLGTTLIDMDTNLVIGDITEDGQKVIAARGGRGGRGNKAFANRVNTAPMFSEKGEPGEERVLKLSLSVIADVGLIGMPSVGKSTILSLISRAKPKIASYHFTTLSPNVGVVTEKGGYTFIMADLPGLVEGASEGIGLGDKFLKHASRCKVLAHVLDIGAEEGRDPIEDYEIISKEIERYNPKMLEKQMVVIANKMDLPNAEKNLKEFKKAYPDILVIPISAATLDGLDKMVDSLAKLVKETESKSLYDSSDFEDVMYYEFKEEKPFTIEKEDDLFVIKGKKIEKLYKMTNMENDEAALRFARKLKRLGIDDALEEAGAKKGDEVRICDMIFEFKE